MPKPKFLNGEIECPLMVEPFIAAGAAQAMERPFSMPELGDCLLSLACDQATAQLLGGMHIHLMRLLV